MLNWSHFIWGHMYPVSQVNGTHLYIREDSNNNNKMVMMKKEIPNCTRSYGTFFTKSTLVKWKWFCRMLSVSCTNDTHCTLYGTYSFDISLSTIYLHSVHFHFSQFTFIEPECISFGRHTTGENPKNCASLSISLLAHTKRSGKRSGIIE